MPSPTNLARLFGIFFILTFVSYGIGSTLTHTILDYPLMLVNVYENKGAFVIGIVLMTLIHSVFNLALPIILLPIIKPYHTGFSYGYFSFTIMATLLLTIGGLLLLVILPLSNDYATSNFASLNSIELIANLLIKGNFYAYHLGMCFWGVGSLMLTFILFQSRLIPKAMSIWGMMGYLILIVGSLSQLFAQNAAIEVYSVALGGSFEICLSLWLIVKGLNHKQSKNQSKNEIQFKMNEL